MQRRLRFGTVIVLVLGFGFLLPQSASTQAQQPPAQQPPKSSAAPEAQAPVVPAPYKPVVITLPEPSNDPSFEAFRKEVAGIAQRKDRAALARLIVGKGFFWERDSGNDADPNKSGIANFAAAIGLDSPDDAAIGWDTVAVFAEDPTVFELPERSGVVCGPADPGFDEGAFQALLDGTQTDVGDWIYPAEGEVELRAAARPDAAVVEKVELTFIRILAPEDSADPAAADFVRVMVPSGKIGFVRADEMLSLGVSQICYVKQGDAWKITGVLGGVGP